MFARKLIAAIALTAAATAAGSPAIAQDLDTSTVTVSFADLDLGNVTGMSRLDTRLRIAARKVCDSGSREVGVLRKDAECRKRALAGARTDLAALNGGRGGRTEVALRR